MTKPSTIATQRSLREVIADDSHALTFQTSGQYRAALLKHEPIEHTHHTEAFAWAVFAKDDNVIIWSKNRAQVESASKEYGRPIVPVIALPAAQQAAVPAMHPALQHAFVVSAEAWFSARKLLEDDQHPNVVLAWECMLGCLSLAAQQAAAPDGPLINEGASAPGTPEAPETAAARDVLAERQRQVKAEGYDHENDDNYVNDEMAAAAAFYVMPPGVRDWPMDGTSYGATMGEAIYPDWMPPKFGDRRRDLVKGAALAMAEIERLDRAAAPKGGA